jgi:protoheme IX farnesyltransferase
LIKDYYALAKPGIVYGNALTAAAGFLYAQTSFDAGVFIAALSGLSLIIASACVVNNLFDRDIDARMERTKDRARALERIGKARSLAYAAALLVVGATLLYAYANLLALGIALAGYGIYLGIYTPLKRVSEHAVLVGAFAGAVPPLVGYTAVTNTFDATALLLGIALISWQMAHFSAIALYRIEEYRAARIPVFPIRQGRRSTVAMMTAHAFIFFLTIKALALVGHASAAFLLIAGVLGIAWVVLCIYGFNAPDAHRWARVTFFYSLVILIAFSVMLAAS